MNLPESVFLRLFIVVICCGSIVLLLNHHVCEARGDGSKQVPTRPNIIMLFADDMGYGDLGITGHPTIRTPNLDRMAMSGMRFTQFYNGAPICSPSRAALLTGRLPVRNGVYTQDDYPGDLIYRVFYPSSTGGLPASEISVARQLQSSGYHTGIIGKWHLGHLPGFRPLDHGFEYFYGLPYSQDEGCPMVGTPFQCHEWQNIWPGVPLYENDTIIQQPVNLKTLMPRYNERALNFLEAYQNDSFFLYMAYDEVHMPLFASDEFINTSRRGIFGDAMAEMDASIGLILNKIHELGIAENTLVFFASDNGPWLTQNENSGSAGLLSGGKGSTWEGGMRTPGIAYMPGWISPFQVNMDVASTMDLFSTFSELAGVPIPTDRIYDGTSLTKALFGGSKSGPDTFFFYRDHTLMAVRVGPFKAHFWTRDGFGVEPPVKHDPPLLYHLEHDPGEHYALDTSLYPEVMQAIHEAVARHEADLKKGVPQLDPQDPSKIPCCSYPDPLPLSKCVCGQQFRPGVPLGRRSSLMW